MYMPPINPTTDYCIVRVDESTGITWEGVMSKVLQDVGAFGPNTKCQAVFTPLCYSSGRAYGDVFYLGAADDRRYHWADRGITQPRSYFRFTLMDDGQEYTTRAAYDLQGNPIEKADKVEELHELSLNHLRYFKHVLGVNPCAVPSLPSRIAVPNY